MHRNLWLSGVALASDEAPDPISLNAALDSLGDDVPPRGAVRPQGNVLTIPFAGQAVAIALVPQPMPWEQIEGPAECAWHWPEATQVLAQHEAHLLVTLLDERSDAVEKAMLFTRILSAIVRSCDAVAVYWGPGRLVHAPQAFIEESVEMSREALPLYLWIDFRVEPRDDGALRLFTTGLEAFGYPEIEVRHYEGEAQTLRETVYNVCHFVLEQGKSIKDGDRIDIEASAKVSARETESLVDGATQVVALEIDG